MKPPILLVTVYPSVPCPNLLATVFPTLPRRQSPHPPGHSLPHSTLPHKALTLLATVYPTQLCRHFSGVTQVHYSDSSKGDRGYSMSLGPSPFSLLAPHITTSLVKSV